MNPNPKQRQLLIREALRWFFASATPSHKSQIRQWLTKVIREEFQPLQANEGRQVIEDVEEARKSSTRSPPDSFLRLIGLAGLCAWAKIHHPNALDSEQDCPQSTGSHGLP